MMLVLVLLLPAATSPAMGSTDMTRAIPPVNWLLVAAMMNVARLFFKKKRKILLFSPITIWMMMTTISNVIE